MAGKYRALRNQSGFTMLEIVVVLLIGGLLIGLILPKISQTLVRLHLTTAARQMVADIREVREVALTQRQVYEVKFYTAGDYYQINTYKVQSNGSITVQPIEQKRLPSQVSIEKVSFAHRSPPHALRFNLFGEPAGAPAGNGTVVLKAGRDFMYVIISKSGRIRSSNVPATDGKQ